MPGEPGRRTHTVATIAALAAAGAILAFLVIGSGVAPRTDPGLVHSTEIKIAAEIGGRLARFAVKPGQTVHKGDDLVEIANPELSANLVLTNAQLGEAQATRDRVYAGMRVEQVDALARQTEIAKAGVTLGEQEFARKSQLVADGFASRQDFDKAAANLDTARAKLAVAEEAHQAARLGPTKEELQIADAKVEVAAASVAVVAARVAKLRIRAPADGVIRLLVAEPGEAIVPAQPLMTLEAADEGWASFNIREDRIGKFRPGTAVQLLLAGGNTPIDARVTEIVPRGEFAVWRAARVAGDHDLNTFLLRIDPITSAPTLQPGMTVTAAAVNGD